MKKYLRVNNDRFVLFLTENRIQARVKELGRKVSKEYKGRVPIFIGILNGAFVFMADLIRNVSIDCEIDFLKLSSYGDAKISSGNVRMLKELNCQVEGRDIIIVEDIVDSGLSVDFMIRLVSQQKPRSYKVVTLLYKKDAAKIHVPIDYVGFVIPNYFVIGYGLDYSQKVRNLRAIYRIANERTDAGKR
ncbi:MAG: hypoxanthine phosphoribosyltransferase [Ignavibacteria bacterium 13_1_40CM_2_61_4]|nr:MAG: hypoxanthine phosphoribosyltransferase [Ignavibacteria bacterium 13_1_40CM_2_61_4]